MLIALLAVASFSAITAGINALQATMVTFGRILPYADWRVRERLTTMEAADSERDQLAGLLLAQDRTRLIGDWKIRRLKAARFWFIATILVIGVATVVVIGQAL